MQRQEACAQFVISSFNSSTLGKISNLKRTREKEFENCVTRIHGPARKRIKAAYGEARRRIIEAGDGAEMSRIRDKLQGGRSGMKGKSYPIQQLCRERRERVNELLKGQPQAKWVERS